MKKERFTERQIVAILKEPDQGCRSVTLFESRDKPNLLVQMQVQMSPGDWVVNSTRRILLGRCLFTV